MADTAVAVTAGSGTNIDTRTEGTNGNHRQVVVLGDPATNAGVAPVDATAGLKVDLGADNDVAASQSGTWNITNISGTVSLPSLAATSTKQSDGSQKTQVVDGSGNVVGATSNALDVNIKSAGATVGIAPLPITAGGCSTYHVVSAASDNAANIKASAGQIYGVTVFNNASTPRYVKFHNTAGTPTAGTGVVRTVGVQAGVNVRVAFPVGIAFGTGIGITIVTGIADNSAVAVNSNDVVVDVDYK
jgi:hypothetical protein